MNKRILLLLVVIVATAAVYIVKVYGPGWFNRDERLVAQEIAEKVRARLSVPAAVVGSSRGVNVLDGKLRLEIVDRRERSDSENTAHFHVIAHLANSPFRGLDACVIGMGENPEVAISNVAEIYVRSALPPIISLIKPEISSEAKLFAGREPWGVPGFRGWAGDIRAQANAEIPKTEIQKTTDVLFGAPLYEGLSDLPNDGHSHLLKVILMAENGSWKRSIELDGQPTSIQEERWTGAPAPTHFMITTAFAVFEKRDRFADAGARESALTILGEGAPWLSKGDVCPTDVLPQFFLQSSYINEACKGGRLRDCLAECEQGSAASCFSAAIEIQESAKSEPMALALFMRACSLGNASGCTNAAATREAAQMAAGSNLAEDNCSRKTYEAICDRAADPWACTMFGVAMLRSKNPDLARVQEVLGRSCKHGSNPACSSAQAILKSLNKPAVER